MFLPKKAINWHHVYITILIVFKIVFVNNDMLVTGAGDNRVL